MSETVIVVPYRGSWPREFESEAALLRRVFGAELVEAHHIGSTSVPGLAAKPIVDLLPVVRSIAIVDSFREAVEAAGWRWFGEHGIPGRRFLVRFEPDGTRRSHAHVFAAGDPQIERHLRFRDALRADPRARAEYQALKLELARRCASDRDRYQAGKHEFIAAVMNHTSRSTTAVDNGRPANPGDN